MKGCGKQIGLDVGADCYCCDWHCECDGLDDYEDNSCLACGRCRWDDCE